MKARCVLALVLATGALACAHTGHGTRGGAAHESESCSEGCPMHAEMHGAAGGGTAAAGGAHAGHAAMRTPGGMHDAHAARHAAIDRLVAIEDIQQLKARYMRCIDTKDLACLRDTVFTADTELHFKGSDYETAVKGWPEIEKFYQGAFTPQKFGMHQVHTREIEVSGDTANGTWYLHDVFVNLEQNTTLQGSALYRDDYVKVNGAWRIAKSTYQRLWEETSPRDPRTKLGSKPVKD